MERKDLNVVIMAAGKGTRMKSKLPKVLHKVAGEPMLSHVINSAKQLEPNKIITIIGYESNQIIDYYGDSLNVCWTEQKEQLGTGHAVMQVVPELTDYKGDILILSGDVPLLSIKTMKNFIDLHRESNAKATILTTILENPFGYGRIIKNKDGNVVKIVEEKDSSPEEKLVQEINSGTYCFDWESLSKYIKELKPSNAQKEYYLTDVIKLFVDNELSVKSYQVDNPDEVLGINDRITLSYVSKKIRTTINNQLMLSGVTILDPDTTYIDSKVKIGEDTIVYPNTIIEGNTTIGENCVIGPNTQISNSTIGNNVKIVFASVFDSKIANKTSIGPYSRIREHADIGENCKIGNFVELKKTIFENDVKASHLSYLGDAEIGEKTNVGAGTITCNYDGKRKHKTIMGSNVFVGSNSTLVAPITLESDSYVAAGSVITETVPKYSLGIGRGRQKNIDDWVIKRREKEK